MIVHDIVGYWASTMVFLTFVTRDMRLLRILAVVSNVAFLSYGLLAWLPPVFCLHLVLLPLNAIRLGEILQAQPRVGPSAGDAGTPHLHPSQHADHRLVA